MQSAHRAGPLKQSNKTHSTGRHRSKGAVDNANRGRVGVKQSGKKNKAQLSRMDRKHQLAQSRSKKKADVLAKKRAIGGADCPPILVAVVDLQSQLDAAAAALVQTIRTCADDIAVTESKSGATHVAFPRFRQRFAFIRPDSNSPLQVLDAAKVSDIVIFLISAQEDFDRDSEETVAQVLAQGLPAEPVFLVTDLDALAAKKQGDAKKTLLKALNKRFPVEKLHLCRNEQEGVLFLRHLGSQKRKMNNLRDRRSHLIAEELEVEGEDATEVTLKVTGYVRSQTLSANRLVHLPGLGSFALDRIETCSDPHPLETKGSRGGGKGDVTMGDEEVRVLSRRDADSAEALISENEPEMFGGEQYLSPEDEEAMSAEPSVNGDGKAKKKKTEFKVPKGTSDYQAAWIIDQQEGDDDDDEYTDDDSDEDDENMEAAADEGESEEEEDTEDYETMTVTSEANMDEGYDEKNFNWAEEQETIKKMKVARTDEMWPDEVDTPIDQLAKTRFQKYRGLKSFRTSPWDPKENLPADYGKIFMFQNFNRTKKAVLAQEALIEGAEVGQHVTIYIKDVPKHLINPYLDDKSRQLIVYGMLPHENKMSVLNFVVKRHSLGHQDAIASKERLIFHCGYRRFAACPIFSQHTNGGKHKYERYWRAGSTVVMTVFAPIFFPPSSVVVCQEMPSGRLELMGTGSLLSVDADRLVIKRTVLSGHPFKTLKRSAVVRFMFFNREDIDWFMPVELRTKYGKKGHIKTPLGTHGHMKCAFDKQLSQQDTVMLNLFKRVFPKWNYDPFVADPTAKRELMEEDVVETLQLRKKKKPKSSNSSGETMDE